MLATTTSFQNLLKEVRSIPFLFKKTGLKTFLWARRSNSKKHRGVRGDFKNDTYLPGAMWDE